MKPWLSVIVPVHNGASLLGATLESAAAALEADPQAEGEGIEFLLYNSGDDQGAARKVAEGYRNRLDLTWHETPEIKPWTAKTNRGVVEARASHIAMLHQDDLWLPGHIAAVRRAVAVAPQAQLSIASSRFAAPDGRLLGSWRLPFAPGHHDGATVAATLLVQNTVAIPSPVIRRDAWLAVGGMDEELWYTADWDLYLKLARAGEVLVRETATTAFRLHGNSLTITGSRNATAFRAQHETVLQRHMAAATPGSAREARASILVNCALAAARGGTLGDMPRALWALARLGPTGILRYLERSRLIDRLLPRLRLSLAGTW